MPVGTTRIEGTEATPFETTATFTATGGRTFDFRVAEMDTDDVRGRWNELADAAPEQEVPIFDEEFFEPEDIGINEPGLPPKKERLTIRMCTPYARLTSL